jgi:hypothetical protein
MKIRPWFTAVLAACLSCALSGCQAFLYPLISDKNAIEDTRVEGKHQWTANGEPCDVVVTKVRAGAYKASVTQSAGKTELLLQLTKIKGQIFFQLSAFPAEPAKQLDDQSGEGMEWAFLTRLTSRPTYLVGKIVSFDPHLRITFFDTRSAAQKYLPKDIGDSFQSFPLEYSHPQRFDGLVIMPPDKLREFIESAADDPTSFVDWGFAK